MKHTLLITSAFITLGLTACQTTSTNPDGVMAPNERTAAMGATQIGSYKRPSATPEDQADRINKALERAAMRTASNGGQKQSLSYLEKIYARKPNDPVAAVNYGKALRESGQNERAAIVLEPLAKSEESPALAKTEYAATQLALGNNGAAEKYAQKAVIQDPGDARAYHYLGVALDSKGKHVEAERAFRKGLDIWEGDPIPIMNNLALNLASQNNLEEAYEILQRAKAIAPNRIEVERNLRIVKALIETHNYDPKDYL